MMQTSPATQPANQLANDMSENALSREFRSVPEGTNPNAEGSLERHFAERTLAPRETTLWGAVALPFNQNSYMLSGRSQAQLNSSSKSMDRVYHRTKASQLSFHQAP